MLQAGTFDHCFLWNIPASTDKIAQNSVLGNEGINSARHQGYYGPARLQAQGISSRFTLKHFSNNLKSELAEPFEP